MICFVGFFDCECGYGVGCVSILVWYVKVVILLEYCIFSIYIRYYD